MLPALVAQLLKNFPDICFLEYFGRQFIRHLSLASYLSRCALAIDTEALLYRVPINYRAVSRQQIHSFVYAGVLQVGRTQELVDRFQGDLVGIVYELGRFLRDLKLEDFPLFVGLNEIVAAVELVLDD